MASFDIMKKLVNKDSSQKRFQVKIINRQTGQPVNGPDEQGEICVKSAQCFIGYLNRQDITNQVSKTSGAGYLRRKY